MRVKTTELLASKYVTSRDYYNTKLINDIIYNEPIRIVAIFKDYLISDDASEFLKRTYCPEEMTTRIPKILEFYSKNS
jgi:hypothetical protein